MPTGAGALTVARHPQNGLVTGTTLGSTTETHEYNELGEPSRQTAVAAATQVFDVQIARDDLGRITQRIEVVDGITRVFQYGYDLAGRLETVTRNGNLVAHYTYDANGNRLTAEGEAYGGGLPIVATYDDQDRLLTYGGATYTYTANGELARKTVGGQTTSYVYDTLGNLVRVTKPDGQVIAYTVDGRGRRVGKSINGVRMKGWLYADQLRPVAELDGNGTVVSRFVYGVRANVPEYMIRGGVTYRIFSDHLGSPRVIVNSATGQVVQRMDFQAFGEIIQDSKPGWQPFGFAGGLYDHETGLIRFGARDYDPEIARWTSKDPIGFSGLDAGLYSYAQGDPLRWIDPSGFEIVGALLGGAFGAVAGVTGALATPSATTSDAVIGGALGFFTGLALGLADPTAGLLSFAARAGALGFYGNLEGQLFSNLVKERSLTCINVPSLIGSTIGSAIGGAMGRIATSAAATTAMGRTGLANLAQGLGLAPAVLGGPIASEVSKGSR